MSRSRTLPQLAAVVVVLSLLLTACRVTDVPATAYPAVGSYPGPRPSSFAAAPTAATRATVQPAALTAVPATAKPAAPTPPPAATPGEEAFALTIVHSGEVAGEVVPCG